MAQESISKPQWYYNLTVKDKKPSHINSVTSPPAYTTDRVKKNTVTSSKKKRINEENDELKIKKAREIAFAPAKSIPTNMIMSYFSGSSLQMVPLTMTFMMFFTTPFKQLVNVNEQFVKLESESNGSSILFFKIIYIICVLGTMGIGVYKLSSMGLLPNTRSDWLAWEISSEVMERSI